MIDKFLFPLFVLAFLTATVPSRASAEKVNIMGKDYDYRLIGTLNKELSDLCAGGKFNQREKMKYAVFFEKNGVYLGGAKGAGWNLYDPTRIAAPDVDYWFRNDGFSDCQVFSVPLE